MDGTQTDRIQKDPEEVAKMTLHLSPEAPLIVPIHENRLSPSGKAETPGSALAIKDMSSDCNRLAIAWLSTACDLPMGLLFAKFPAALRLLSVAIASSMSARINVLSDDT